MTEANPEISKMGKGYQLHQTQSFEESIEKLFNFFEKPENLETITPPKLRFQVKNYSTPVIQEGTKIRYKLSIRGIPVKWVSVISEYEENEYFIDEMIEGPYRTWNHVHTFEKIQGQTVVGDQVYYEMPYRWLGTIAHNLFVMNDLKYIFNYRSEVLADKFNQ